MKRYIIFTALLLLPCSLYSQATLYANIRYRYEFQNNYNQKLYGAGNDGFLLQRIRTGYILHFSKIDIAFGIQDSRAYDVKIKDRYFKPWFLEGLQNNPNKDPIEPFNTYIQIKPAKNLRIKLGRQTIFFGDKRIFGPGAWGNTGRWIWDALRIQYRWNKNTIDAFLGATIVHDPEKLSLNHRYLYKGAGIYTHLEISPYLKIEPTLVWKVDREDIYPSEVSPSLDDFKAFYYGGRIYGRLPHKFFYDFTWIKEEGDYGKDDLDAYGLHLLLGRSFGFLKVSLEYSFGSGDKNPKDGKRESFDGVFGARDKMYGRMNLFSWKNLKDIQFNLEGWGLKIEAHRFFLDEERDGWSLNPRLYRDKSGRVGKEVGEEVDVTYKKKIKNLIFQVGYGHFFPGDFIKDMKELGKIKDSSDANWFFMQVELKLSKEI